MEKTKITGFPENRRTPHKHGLKTRHYRGRTERSGTGAVYFWADCQ